MRLYSSKKEIRLNKKALIMTTMCIAVVVGIYVYLTHRPAPAPLPPVVQTAPATKEDVNIYGEYVGRVRAQRFVEVHARVEGYLEQMLFAEGTYVKKNQVLFIIAAVLPPI